MISSLTLRSVIEYGLPFLLCFSHLHYGERGLQEQKALKQQMFGPMKPLTGDEYDTIFSTTGIDIDGRRELLQSCFIPHIEACVKRFVVFVKAIPGFTRLPLADQIALVKGIGTLKHTCTHAHTHTVCPGLPR